MSDPAKRHPVVSVVVPAHNEAPNLERTVSEIRRVLCAVGLSHEIVVVDDGSDDDTAAVARRLLETAPTLRVVTHTHNEGYGRAVWDGVRQAGGEWVVLLPADLQYRFDELPRLLAAARSHDIVVGARVRRADPFHRRLNARCWSLLARTLLGVPVRDVNSGFKVYRRSLLAAIDVMSSGAMMDAEVLARATRRGASIVEIPVEHLPRTRGRQSGARLAVIARALREFWLLYPEMRRVSGPRADPACTPGTTRSRDRTTRP